jgi:Flp pilus assembly protein TadG
MFALGIVGLMVMATLVIDGSQAYSQRRRAQNAADAAAIATARQLDRARWYGASWSSVNVMAAAITTNNGATAFTCTIINPTGATIGQCSSQAAVESSNAAGVRITVDLKRNASFGSIAGRKSVTAVASSAATIQPLAGTATPFIICGKASVGGYNILNDDNTINVAAATAMGEIVIQGSQVPTCGAGSAFKGKIEDGEDVIVPGWVEADNGNGYEADIEVAVANATPCPSGGPFNNCDMIIPIADEGAGNGNNITLHGVAWAVFRVVGDGTGNPKYKGTFKSALVYASGGITTNQQVTNAATVRVIRIIS